MSTLSPEPVPERPRTVVRRALVRFVAAGSLALLVVSGTTVVVAQAISKDVAVRHAKSRGITFAQVVSAPLVDDGVRAGGPGKLDVFSRVMRSRLKDDSMVHIKVWDRSARIIWADEPSMRGQVFPFEPAVAGLPSKGGAVAAMSELDKAENVLDGPEARLLEVYVSTLSADGEPIIVETYWSTDQIDDDARAILLRLAPLAIGALLLFAAVLLPLAWSLARRVDRAQAESKRSLGHALSASDLERRRIARDLHDGVMQEVAGAGYALSMAGRAMPPEAEASRRLVEDVSSAIGSVGASLRSLLADIYPPHLARDGLSAAVMELADRAAKEGVVVEVEVNGDDLRGLPIEVVQLCYRVIREALRNVLRHAQASHAAVHVTVPDGAVSIVVVDDGRGLPAQAPEGEHLGLRLLEDTLLDLGGALTVESPSGGGTTLSAAVPLKVVMR